jgi:hypothetical protein
VQPRRLPLVEPMRTAKVHEQSVYDKQ